MSSSSVGPRTCDFERILVVADDDALVGRQLRARVPCVSGAQVARLVGLLRSARGLSAGVTWPEVQAGRVAVRVLDGLAMVSSGG